MRLTQLTFLIFVLAIGSVSWAARGGSGGHSVGFGLAMGGPTQGDLNGVIDEINSAESKSFEKLGTAYELHGYYQYRISGTIFAIQFRPSYFTQTSKGSGYEMKLNGFTFFPMLRLYPLENEFIRFFMQTGLGYGKLNGEMSGTGNVSFSGAAFGATGGLGAEFCFTDFHCVVIEGNIRYLPIERNVVDSSSGTHNGFDTPSSGGELENNNKDVGTTMSGVMGAISYQMNF